MSAKRLTTRRQLKQRADGMLGLRFHVPLGPAAGGPVSGMALAGLRDKTGPEYPLYILEQQARAGDASAARRLAHIALDLAATLAELAQANPGLLRPYAKQCHAWPVVAMAREAQPARIKELFSQVGLGAEALVELDPATAKWRPDAAGVIAYALLSYMEAARRAPERYGQAGGQVRRLPPFHESVKAEWWEAARAALLDAYPEPDKVEALNRLVTDPSRRRSPGRIKQAVLDILKARFFSLAPNPYQT